MKITTPLSVANTSKTLRIPFSRTYNALTALGYPKKGKLPPRAISRLIVELQQGSVSFTTLASVLGEETTLADLATMEQELVREKYRDMGRQEDPSLDTEEEPFNIVDFTGTSVEDGK